MIGQPDNLLKRKAAVSLSRSPHLSAAYLVLIQLPIEGISVHLGCGGAKTTEVLCDAAIMFMRGDGAKYPDSGFNFPLGTL